MSEFSFDTIHKSDRLRDMLQQSITDGTLRPGDQLPSEPELVALHRVSRSTVREAITALVQAGLVNRVHGKGTFVAEPRPEHRTFAVMMPYLFFSDSVPFGAGTDVLPRLMQSIEGAARREKTNVLLYLNNRIPALERENIESVLQLRVDGVLLNYVGEKRDDDAVDQLQASGIPFILLDRYFDDVPLDFVVTDNALGAYRATRLLAAQGFQRIVHVTSPGDHSALRDRRAGYERAMRELGHSTQVLHVEEKQLDETGSDTVSEEERAYAMAQTLLEATDQPLAVFAAEAPILAGLWRAIQEHGLPHDRIAFACFDEPFIDFPRNVFSLKVIQPFAEIGRRSVNILQERIAKTGPDRPYHVFVEPEVIASKV